MSNLEQADRTVSKIREAREKATDATMASRVSEVINQVRETGDEGLVRLTQKFDSPAIKKPKGSAKSRRSRSSALIPRSVMKV